MSHMKSISLLVRKNILTNDNLLNELNARIDRLKSVSAVKVKKLLLNFWQNTLTWCFVISAVVRSRFVVLYSGKYIFEAIRSNGSSCVHSTHKAKILLHNSLNLRYF